MNTSGQQEQVFHFCFALPTGSLSYNEDFVSDYKLPTHSGQLNQVNCIKINTSEHFH